MAAGRLGPRLVIAGTHSGVGKTTVATGLMAALAARGLRVAGAKVGPDFIDPGYHSMATGRPGRNLDPWICGREAMAPLAARAGDGADVLVIEGVMGLFDGAATGRDGRPSAPGEPSPASTAEVASALGAPVVLVLDGSSISASIAAVVHGYGTFDPTIELAGVVLNQVGSDGHEDLLRAALAPVGIPVLGALRRDPRLAWRDRHLGLVPVVEQASSVRRSLRALGEEIAGRCDLDGLVQLARRAEPTEVGPLAETRRVGRARVAVVGGPAFSFAYRDNLERLREAGAELVDLDPARDQRLPEGVSGLYAAGGFPEVHLEDLAANRPLLDDIARRVRAGLTTWAECGGLLWLSRSLDGRRLCGAIPGSARMGDHLTLGYRRATVRKANPVAPEGAVLHGHEFHYSTIDPAGDALEVTGRDGSRPGGFASGSLLASYLHLHLGAHPAPAERFVAAAAASCRATPAAAR